MISIVEYKIAFETLTLREELIKYFIFSGFDIYYNEIGWAEIFFVIKNKGKTFAVAFNRIHTLYCDTYEIVRPQPTRDIVPYFAAMYLILNRYYEWGSISVRLS